MKLNSRTLQRHLVDRASQPYRCAGHFAYRFARGKLGGDPMFLEILQRGLIVDGARVLDLGCGQGLLAAWLLAARHSFESGEWVAGWAEPGIPADIRGIDLLASDIRRAQDALKNTYARFEQGDLCGADFGQADVVMIMDVLHYVDFFAQDEVLRRVRDALLPGGLLIARVGDDNGGLRFKLSNWVDRAVAFCRGGRLLPTYGRPLRNRIQTLESLGFRVETVGMNGNLPFANVMLIARLG